MRRVLAGIVLAVGLGGCIPLPMLPRGTELRTNLGRIDSMTIADGVTTRAELMLVLGEPDGWLPDGSRMAWTSGRSKGGVAVLFGAGYSGGVVTYERMTYRRLMVVFDPAGRVAGSFVEERNCTEITARDPARPCIGMDWVRGLTW